MKKALIYILLSAAFLFGINVADAITVFYSNQVGTTPSAGRILQTDGTNSSWVATSSLGIIGGGSGTSTPSSGSAGFIQYASTSAGYFSATSTLFFNPTLNRFGIGTSTPMAALDVYSNNTSGFDPCIRLGGNFGGDRDVFMCRFNDNSGTPSGDFFYLGTGTTTASTSLAINLVSGFTGIGTTTPLSKLHVSGGDIRLDTTGRVLVPNGTYNVPQFSLDSFGTGVSMTGNDEVYLTGNATGVLGIKGGASPVAKLKSNAAFGWSSGLVNGSLDTGLSRSSANTVALGNGTALNSTGTLLAGLIGLGRSPTTYVLETNGTIGQYAAASAAGYLRTNASGLASASALNPGIAFFGCGAGESCYGADLGYSSLSNRYRTRLFSGSSDTDVAFGFQNANPPTAQSHFTEVMTVTGTSRVGLGTTTPLAKLHVTDGTNGIADFRFSSGSGGVTPTVAIANVGSGGKAVVFGAGTSGAYMGYQEGGQLYFKRETAAAISGNTTGAGTDMAIIDESGRWSFGSNAAPTGMVMIQGPSGTTTPTLVVATSTGASIFTIGPGGHIITGGGTPTVSSCGTSPSISGNDTAGTVTVGSGVVTACTITFARTRLNTPKVVGVVTGGGLNIAGGYSAKSTTAVTFSFAATVGAGTFDYYIVE